MSGLSYDCSVGGKDITQKSWTCTFSNWIDFIKGDHFYLYKEYLCLFGCMLLFGSLNREEVYVLCILIMCSQYWDLCSNGHSWFSVI